MLTRSRLAVSRSFRRCALVVSEPTRALSDMDWLKKHRPVVLVLTSGPDPSALDPVSRRLQEVGCTPSSIFGRLTLHQLLLAIDQKNYARFKALTLEMADLLLREPTDRVAVGPSCILDPASVACRWLVDAAAQLVWAHRPTMLVQDYVPDRPGPLEPFLYLSDDPRLLSLRDALRDFVQSDLAWAA